MDEQRYKLSPKLAIFMMFPLECEHTLDSITQFFICWLIESDFAHNFGKQFLPHPCVQKLLNTGKRMVSYCEVRTLLLPLLLHTTHTIKFGL